jgi:hypothetical protein
VVAVVSTVAAVVDFMVVAADMAAADIAKTSTMLCALQQLDSIAQASLTEQKLYE